MNRVLVGFVRNVNFMLEGKTLTARIPMPVEGEWAIRTATKDALTGDMVVVFKPKAPNPLVETERPPQRAPKTAGEIERSLRL